MKKNNDKGIMLIGNLRSAGLTTYMRQGKLVSRVSKSQERRSNTLPQFIQRQRIRHATALWGMMKHCEPTFTLRQTAYQNFRSLASHLPVVFVKKTLMDKASFLMPGIPMSDGTLPTIEQRLGEVDGVAALLTDLEAPAWDYQTELWLYTAEQRDADSVPRVWFSKRAVAWEELMLTDGRYALKDAAFADDMKGWALVMVKGERCSAQTIVTRCTLYERFTTREALMDAAESYGGLTPSGML